MMMINVGLVGCGVISQTHLKAWAKQSGFQVQGVFDVSTELAQKRAGQFHISTIYPDLDALIAASDVVDVCTPPPHARGDCAAGHCGGQALDY